jgi:hypothetical protein
MAVYFPPLDEPGKRVLRTLQRAGVAAGWQLMSGASVTEEELKSSANALESLNLISVKGTTTGPEIGSSYFNIQPSNAALAEMVLNSK